MPDDPTSDWRPGDDPSEPAYEAPEDATRAWATGEDPSAGAPADATQAWRPEDAAGGGATTGTAPTADEPALDATQVLPAAGAAGAAGYAGGAAYGAGGAGGYVPPDAEPPAARGGGKGMLIAAIVIIVAAIVAVLVVVAVAGSDDDDDTPDTTTTTASTESTTTSTTAPETTTTTTAPETTTTAAPETTTTTAPPDHDHHGAPDDDDHDHHDDHHHHDGPRRAARGRGRAVTAVDAPAVDLLSPAFYGDLDAMHAAFRWLRANDPVHRDEANGLWGVTRHADVMDVERRADVFSSATGYRSHHEPDEDNMIAQDDPGHLDQRRLVNRRFTPRAVAAMEGYLTDLVDDVLESALAGGSMEVVGELAAPVPARLTAHLLGFAEEHWPDIRTWSERLMRYDEVDTDEAKMLDFVAAIMEFVPVLMETVAARRECPADDLVSDWVQAEAKGCPMTDSKLVNETGLVISGGAETTRTVISRGLVAFAEHPTSGRPWPPIPHWCPVPSRS
jgi:hypothetical protein